MLGLPETSHAGVQQFCVYQEIQSNQTKNRKNQTGVEMFLETQAQGTMMSLSWFFHRLAGWKLVMTVPLRKEIYLVYLFKKCTVFKKQKQKKKACFLTLKHA